MKKISPLGLGLLLLAGCRPSPQTAVAQNEIAPVQNLVPAPQIANDSALDRYLKKPETVFDWKPIEGDGDANLKLTSQTWQNTVWTHRLQIFQPQNPKYPDAALLYATFGAGSFADTFLGRALADATGATVVNVFNVPNQPLFGKTEDALIAYSFQKYMETGDESWPLLFPMTKSVTQAMDAISQWSQKNGKTKIERFVVAGASKRGWTTWLAGAGDKRVVAIVPIVYDFLNMGAQLERQKQVWGAPSEQLKDYTALGLTDKFGESRGAQLSQMVDPWTFRERLTLPKLIVNATNDRYWGHDAFDVYRRDLKGPTSVLYLPNAPHHIGDALPTLAGSAAAWGRLVLDEKPVPIVNLKVEGDKWAISTDAKPTATRLWVAVSETRDFRRAKWKALEGKSGTLPDEKFVAAFGEIEIAAQPLPLKLSSVMWNSF